MMKNRYYVLVAFLCVILLISMSDRTKGNERKNSSDDPTHRIERDVVFKVTSVEGWVWSLSFQDEKLLANVQIELRHKKDNSIFYKTISDEKGGFSIPDVEPGTYLLNASRRGYFDITYKVIVSREADPTAKVIFTMYPLGLDWKKVLLLSTYREKDRYTWEAGGELRGFKCDPEGSYIDEIEKPIHTTEITGSIYDMAAKTYLEKSVPLAGAVFQMRGPDKCDKVYSSTTDEEGMFRIGTVPEGTYKFLVSFNGFQTLIGNMLVSSRSEKIPIVFYMKIAQ